MHSVGKGAFGMDLLHAEGPKPGIKEMLHGPRLERAIGVIYRPDTERWSHYFKACALPHAHMCKRLTRRM